MKLDRAFCILLACTAGSAAAQDKFFLAGGEAAPASYYSYVGVVLPGPFSKDGQGFKQRYWVDRFGYEYDGAPGRVKARATGAEAALGYGVSNAAGDWGAIFLGLRYTDTTLTPDDVGAKARGSQTGLRVQFEGETALSASLRGSGILSYTNEQDAYWVRGRLMHRVNQGWSVGGEAVAAGNRESDFTSIGAIFSLQATTTTSVGFKVGYRAQDGENGAYGGIELFVAF
jgi:hypothetical protein